MEERRASVAAEGAERDAPQKIREPARRSSCVKGAAARRAGGRRHIGAHGRHNTQSGAPVNGCVTRAVANTRRAAYDKSAPFVRLRNST